jgi:amidase
MSVFNAERTRMTNAGAQVVDVTLDVSSWLNDESTLLIYEFKVGIDAYLASHPAPNQATDLQGLIDFNNAHAAQVLQYFGQELFIAAQATTGLSAQAYIDAKKNAQDTTGKNGIAALLAANSLDALVSPTTDPAWKVNYTTGDPPITASSGPAATAGYPHLTVPMGTVKGLPIGLSFFAAAWDDAKVLALGYAYEQLPR